MGCTWGAAAPDLDSEASHHHCPSHPGPTHCPPLGVSRSSRYPGSAQEGQLQLSVTGKAHLLSAQYSTGKLSLDVWLPADV